MGADKASFAAVTEEINAYLRFLAETGCRAVDCSKKSLETIEGWGNANPSFPETLETIRMDLGDCRRCRLHAARKNIVFGAGDPHARLVFLGEAPGHDEDLAGEPFVGAAGSLLTKIIEAINLSRASVYLCNIIKCRPPGNKNPMPDEIKACTPFLKRQLRAVNPDFICTLGAFAAQTLLESKEPLSKLRGRFHDYQGIKLIPTYHPASLLRYPDKKRDVWEDMKMLMKAYQEKV
jgi:uracil-DNA glycosylase family 4